MCESLSPSLFLKVSNAKNILVLQIHTILLFSQLFYNLYNYQIKLIEILNVYTFIKQNHYTLFLHTKNIKVIICCDNFRSLQRYLIHINPSPSKAMCKGCYWVVWDIGRDRKSLQSFAGPTCPCVPSPVKRQFKMVGYFVRLRFG